MIGCDTAFENVEQRVDRGPGGWGSAPFECRQSATE
jgi:hypothetical protein